MFLIVEYYDGLTRGWNKLIGTGTKISIYNRVSVASDNHYKICAFDQLNTTVIGWINEFGSQAAKCDFESEKLHLMWEHGVSMNGTFYYRKSHEYFIQSFDFSMERFKPVCFVPGIINLSQYLEEIIFRF